MLSNYLNKETVKAALREVFPELQEEKLLEITNRLFSHLYVYTISLLLKTEQERRVYQTLLNELKDKPEQKALIDEVVQSKLANLTPSEIESLQKAQSSELVRMGNELYLKINQK